MNLETPGRSLLQILGEQFEPWRRAVKRLYETRQWVIIGTAHKVGSTWLRRLVADAGGYHGYSVPKSLVEKHPQEPAVDIDLRELLEAPLPAGRTIVKSHSFPPPESFVSELPRWIKFITMVRDPRDVVVSASFYLARLPVAKGGWGADFRALSEPERLVHLIEEGSFLSSRLRAWYQCPYALKIRYERLLSGGIGEIQAIADFLGLLIAEQAMHDVYRKHSFKAQTGRDQGQEDRAAFLRKGVAGDWRTYFDDRVKTAFKHSRAGDWNDLLVLMGYEESYDW